MATSEQRDKPGLPGAPERKRIVERAEATAKEARELLEQLDHAAGQLLMPFRARAAAQSEGRAAFLSLLPCPPVRGWAGLAETSEDAQRLLPTAE